MYINHLIILVVLSNVANVIFSAGFNESKIQLSRWKRFFISCNVCTTTNYIYCCEYRRFCCEYITECPAPNSIQCSQTCSWGNCPSGQRCCPVNRKLACCANIVTPATRTTTTASAGTGSTGTSGSTIRSSVAQPGTTTRTG